MYTNERELRILGLSRSGNHAVIRWILAQAPGRHCFLNCAEGASSPFLTARPMGSGEYHSTNIPGLDLAAESAGRFARKDWLVFSHEDAFLALTCSAAFEREHDLFVGASRQRLNVLVLRDPFNLFASRRRAGESTLSARRALRIWMQHAAAFLGRRRMHGGPCLPLSYNAWFTSRAYRRRTATALGLPFTDAEVRAVPDCAGGSSFDGRRYDGCAERMQVLARWKDYVSDPDYCALFTPDVVRRSHAIFGPVAAPLEQQAARLLPRLKPHKTVRRRPGKPAQPTPSAKRRSRACCRLK